MTARPHGLVRAAPNLEVRATIRSGQTLLDVDLAPVLGQLDAEVERSDLENVRIGSLAFWSPRTQRVFLTAFGDSIPGPSSEWSVSVNDQTAVLRWRLTYRAPRTVNQVLREANRGADHLNRFKREYAAVRRLRRVVCAELDDATGMKVYFNEMVRVLEPLMAFVVGGDINDPWMGVFRAQAYRAAGFSSGEARKAEFVPPGDRPRLDTLRALGALNAKPTESPRP